MLPEHIRTVLRADIHKTVHIADKNRHATMRVLRWRQEGPHHFVAEVGGGSYVLRRVDSGSRVKRQRYRWKSLWVPNDSPHIKELALERLKEWARGAAEVHYERNT